MSRVSSSTVHKTHYTSEDDEEDGSVAEALKTAEEETPDREATGVEPAVPEAAPEQGSTSS